MLAVHSHHDRHTDELVIHVRDDATPGELAEMRLPAMATLQDIADEFDVAAFGRTIVAGLTGGGA